MIPYGGHRTCSTPGHSTSHYLNHCWLSWVRFCNVHLSAISQEMLQITTLMARFMGPTWGPSGADRTQVGPMNFVIWVSYTSFKITNSRLHPPIPGTKEFIVKAKICHSWNVPWSRLDPGWDPHREITPEQTPIWSRLADSAHLPLGSARQRTICGRTPVPVTSYGWLSGRLTWHCSRHGFISATISK